VCTNEPTERLAEVMPAVSGLHLPVEVGAQVVQLLSKSDTLDKAFTVCETSLAYARLNTQPTGAGNDDRRETVSPRGRSTDCDASSRYSAAARQVRAYLHIDARSSALNNAALTERRRYWLHTAIFHPPL
jgi:hypothetical protein